MNSANVVFVELLAHQRVREAVAEAEVRRRAARYGRRRSNVLGRLMTRATPGRRRPVQQGWVAT